MMRCFVVLLLVLGLALASPMEKVKRDADVELVGPFGTPLDDGEDMDDDENVFGMQAPRFLPSNFYDLFDQVNQLANRFRLWLNSRPMFGPPFFSGFPGNLPPNYDNSTFTTKVVNGSIITVNETIHKMSSNDSSFVFHTKVVVVKPENQTEGAGVDREVEVEEEVDKKNPDAENDISSVPKVRRSS